MSCGCCCRCGSVYRARTAPERQERGEEKVSVPDNPGDGLVGTRSLRPDKEVLRKSLSEGVLSNGVYDLMKNAFFTIVSPVAVSAAGIAPWLLGQVHWPTVGMSLAFQHDDADHPERDRSARGPPARRA